MSLTMDHNTSRTEDHRRLGKSNKNWVIMGEILDVLGETLSDSFSSTIEDAAWMQRIAVGILPGSY
jgi:hypothetical protein